jgi:hypothetical protein
MERVRQTIPIPMTTTTIEIMDTILFYTPLNLVEIETLRDAGFLAVDRARIIPGAEPEKCLSRPDFLWALGSAIPVVPIGEEQSVLIAVFDQARPSPREESFILASGKVCFEAKDCHALIPLTPTSREINAGRFPNLVLQPAVFAALLEERNLLARLHDQLRGAGAMTSVLCILDASIDLSSANRFHQSDLPCDKLIRKILAYQRHSPAPREPISGLRDLRVLLRESLPNPKELNAPLKKLSLWGEQKWDKTKGFLQVFADPELQSSLDAIDEHWHLPFRAAALGIFLHWRELYLRNGSLDLDVYFDDCQRLVDTTGGQVIAEALWLLGYSAGFSSFSQSYYERLDAPSVFARRRKAIKRIRLQQSDEMRALEPREDEPAAPEAGNKNTDETGAAGKSEGEIAEVDASEDGPKDGAGDSKSKDRKRNSESTQPDILQAENQATQAKGDADAETANEGAGSHESESGALVPDAPAALEKPPAPPKKPRQRKRTDAEPSDAKPSAPKPSDPKPSDPKPSDPKPNDLKPNDLKPNDAEPNDAKVATETAKLQSDDDAEIAATAPREDLFQDNQNKPE